MAAGRGRHLDCQARLRRADDGGMRIASYMVPLLIVAAVAAAWLTMPQPGVSVTLKPPTAEHVAHEHPGTWHWKHHTCGFRHAHFFSNGSTTAHEPHC